MDVCRRRKTHGKLLQAPAILRKRQRNIGRDPQRHENPRGLNAGCRVRYALDIVWRFRRDHEAKPYATCDARGEMHPSLTTRLGASEFVILAQTAGVSRR